MIDNDQVTIWHTNDDCVVLELIGVDFHGGNCAGHRPLLWPRWGGHDGFESASIELNLCSWDIYIPPIGWS